MTRAEVLKTLRGPKYPLLIRIEQMIYDAHMLGMDHVEIDCNIITPKIKEDLLKAGYRIYDAIYTTIKW